MKKFISKVLIITLLFTTSSFNILSSVFTDMLSIKKGKYETDYSSVLSHNTYAADFNYLTVTKTYKKYERSEASYFWYDYEGQGINDTLVTCNGVTWGSEHSRGGFKESEYTVIENYDTYEDLFNALKETNNNYCFFDYQNQNMKEYNGRDFVDFPADNGWSWYFLYVALKDVTITGKSKNDNEILTDSYKNVLSVLNHNDEIYYVPYTTTADNSIMYSCQKEVVNSSIFQQNITLNVNSDLSAISSYSTLFENSKATTIKINDIDLNTYNNKNIATQNEIIIATISTVSEIAEAKDMPLLSLLGNALFGVTQGSTIKEDYEYLTLCVKSKYAKGEAPYYDNCSGNTYDYYYKVNSLSVNGVTYNYHMDSVSDYTEYYYYENYEDLFSALKNDFKNEANYYRTSLSSSNAAKISYLISGSVRVYYDFKISGKSKKQKETFEIKNLCSNLNKNVTLSVSNTNYKSGEYYRKGNSEWTSLSSNINYTGDINLTIDSDLSPLNSLEEVFKNCMLDNIIINNNNFDKIKSMKGLFDSASRLKKVYISTFSAPVCTDMSYMFNGCTNLTNVNLSAFDTKSVENMSYMFSGCTSMENYNFISFNTENVISMEGMFENNSLIEEIDLKSFITSNLTNCKNMFKGNSNLIWVTTTDLFTVNNVIDNGEDMFLNCINIEGEKMTEYDSSVTDVRAAIIDKGGSTWGTDKGYFMCGHRLYITSTISEPTCITDGEYGRYCLGCHNTLSSQPIPALGHNATQSIINIPTCYSIGTASEICIRCNAFLGYITLPKLLTHREPYREVIISDSSCTAIGIKEEYCSDCNVFIATSNIALKAHNFSGWNGDKRSCLVCGYIEKKYSGSSGGGSDSYSGGPLADKTKIDDNNIIDGPLSPDLNAIQVNATYKNAPVFYQKTEKNDDKDDEVEYIEEYEEVVEERSLLERLYDNTIGKLVHNKKERQKKDNIEEENYYTYEMKNQTVLEKSIVRVKELINN